MKRLVLTELNTGLVTDIYRKLQLPLTINSNDSQACYDRIILGITSIALQRIRLSK